MRVSACLIAICGLMGCGEKAPDPKTPAPKSAASVASEAPATVATAAPRPDKSLTALLTAAESCVQKGRVRRACAAFRQLRTALQGKRNDPSWWGALVVKAKGEPAAAQTRLALTLLADGTLQGPRADFLPAVKPMLDSPAPVARAAAMRALSTYDDPDLLARALTFIAEDTSADVREAATYLLGQSVHVAQREKIEPVLLSTLVNDEDPGVRRAAIGALGKLKTQKAVKPLISLLDHPQLGPNAAIQLGGFDDPEAFRAVLSRVARVKKGTTISPSIFAALGRMRRAKAFDAAQVRTVLTDVRPALAKIAHPNGRVGLQMLDRLLEQLGKAEPKAP